MAQSTEYTLRKLTFTKSLRGYSCDEVDTYVAYVNDKYGQLCRECTELRRRLVAANQQNEADAEEEKNAEQKRVCDAMIDEAKLQAARILQEAEKEAAILVRQAEEHAQTIMEDAARHGTKARSDAYRAVAEQSNLADRMVQEIDEFRQQVFALYAEHIASLERLSHTTTAFYKSKNTIADLVPQDEKIAAEAQNTPAGALAQTAMRVMGEMTEPSPSAADVPPQTTEDVETPSERGGEPTEPVESTEWAEPSSFADMWNDTEAAGQAVHDLLADSADDEALSDTASDWTDDMTAAEEPEAACPKDSFPSEDGSAADGEGETDDIAALLADLKITYHATDAAETEKMDPADWASASDADAGSDTEAYEPAGEPADGGAEEPEAENAAEEELPSARAPKKRQKEAENTDMDELFFAEDETVCGSEQEREQDFSLTGEFDAVYAKDKSYRNVQEIKKQPLAVPAAPPKKKFHK